MIHVTNVYYFVSKREKKMLLETVGMFRCLEMFLLIIESK